MKKETSPDIDVARYSRSVLVVAYHLPPFNGSSGVQRTVKFCHYLREHGWQPIVLTVEPRAYVTSSETDSVQLPPDIPVYRSFCLDTARHLSVGGRYTELMALPDRWASWWPSGVIQGSRIVREWRVDAVWSTYPVATAHLIAGTISRTNRLPWVADFRDWMTEGDYPAGRLQRWAYRRTEQFVLSNATAATFTTHSCLSLYEQRYPKLANDGWSVLPNGYDEADFVGVKDKVQTKSGGTITLLHSGYVYPQERSPAGLFEALSNLRKGGFFEQRRLVVRFRGAGDEAHIQESANRFEVGDMVEIENRLPHKAALQEMVDADAQLLIQGQRFDRQVPAKAYEYLRTGRPIFTLAAECSESAKLMSGYGSPYRADMDAPSEIAGNLEKLILDIEANRACAVHPVHARRYDRRYQTATLARILDSTLESNSVLVRT